MERSQSARKETIWTTLSELKSWMTPEKFKFQDGADKNNEFNVE
jgi:hypothetical protein